MNKVVVFNIKSALGCFKRPQSNNNPSTFHILTKSALVGIIAAVCGFDREYVVKHKIYETFGNKIKYSVGLNDEFKIKSWSEYAYNHGTLLQQGRKMHTPIKGERIVDADYNVSVLFDDSDSDVSEIMFDFIKKIKEEMSIFPTYMGMANFPAVIDYIGLFDSEFKTGDFNTRNFCRNPINILDFKNIKTEILPTRLNSHLSHDFDSYERVYFYNGVGKVMANGEYCLVNDCEVEFI